MVALHGKLKRLFASKRWWCYEERGLRTSISPSRTRTS
jgi:hypothetical protein